MQALSTTKRSMQGLAWALRGREHQRLQTVSWATLLFTSQDF